MDQGEPPDRKQRFSLAAPLPRAHAALSPKRRRGVLVRVDGQATDEVLGTADPKLVEKLREYPVSALRRFLAEFGERSTGLKKDDIVARLVLRGPTVFADLPPQKIAPAGPLPAARSSSYEGEIRVPMPPTAEKKTKRGGRREGAGRKKKSAIPAPPSVPQSQSLSEQIGISPVSTRTTPKRRALNSSSSSGSPSGSATFISPMLLNPTLTSTPLPDGSHADLDVTSSIDFANPSSDGYELLFRL